MAVVYNSAFVVYLAHSPEAQYQLGLNLRLQLFPNEHLHIEYNDTFKTGY